MLVEGGSEPFLTTQVNNIVRWLLILNSDISMLSPTTFMNPPPEALLLIPLSVMIVGLPPNGLKFLGGKTERPQQPVENPAQMK